MPGAVERFLEAARARGLSPAVRRFPSGTKTAADAARAVGCDVGQIVKSLVFVADGRPVVALTSGRNRVDPSRLSAVLGAREVRKASAEEARAATGFAIGGTPPFGYPRPLQILLDRDLLGHEVVWAAAGTPDTVFPIAPADLLEASGATVADFAEGAGERGEGAV
ncbi:MAG TPA: YbaK/EbsC family protein [Actinomycetota bacterium]|nr:YbaK/EbsC family protein [Actinomycetota bacterium]